MHPLRIAAVALTVTLAFPAGGLAHPRQAARAPWDAYLPPAGRCGPDSEPGLPAPAQTQAMRCLINWARMRRGLPELRTSESLESVAEAKLRAQASCGEFSHTPCGRSFRSFFRDVGYLEADDWRIAENIAMASGAPVTPRAAMRAWLASSDHRANIFYARFAEQGVAVGHEVAFAGETDVTLWSSEFGWQRARAAVARRPRGRGPTRPRASRHRPRPPSGRRP